MSESNKLLVRELHQFKHKHISLIEPLRTNLGNYYAIKYLQVRYENAITATQHLQEENKRLTMEWNNLNQTLEVIFQFSNFPVDQYCPVTDNVTQGAKT